VEPDGWVALVLVVAALGTFLDIVIAPWLVVFDAIFLAIIIYLVVRQRWDSSGPRGAIRSRQQTTESRARTPLRVWTCY